MACVLHPIMKPRLEGPIWDGTVAYSQSLLTFPSCCYLKFTSLKSKRLWHYFCGLAKISTKTGVRIIYIWQAVKWPRTTDAVW